MLRQAALIGVIALGLPSARGAQADEITIFDLSGVTFASGGVANGYIVVDSTAEASAVSQAQITASILSSSITVSGDNAAGGVFNQVYGLIFEYVNLIDFHGHTRGFNQILYLSPRSLPLGPAITEPLGGNPANGGAPGNLLDQPTGTVDLVTGGSLVPNAGPVLNLSGGSIFDPAALPAGPVSSVFGSIGGNGSSDFYLFSWAGGNLDTVASINGANADGSYEFELLDQSGNLIQDVTLNTTDNFTATIGDNLPMGFYEIGIIANSPNDPSFTIDFATPVEGVPEPGTLTLLGASFAGLGAIRRRKAA